MSDPGVGSEHERADPSPLHGAASPIGATQPTATSSHATLEGLSTIISVAVESLGVDSVGAMLLDGDGPLRVLGASDDVSSAIEAAQIETGTGPGIDAVRTGSTVTVDDIATDGRYRELRERIGHVEVGALLASPIRFRGAVVGNLNAITTRPRSWSSGQIKAHEAYARVVGVLLNLVATRNGSLAVATALRDQLELITTDDIAHDPRHQEDTGADPPR
jgi:GAF domain-containing protein